MLDDLRVLDLTDERGLLAGRLLADLGADVVQVEPPAGSPARSVAPLAADGSSYYWRAYTAGKRSLVADLESPQGRAAITRLAAAADVLITTMSPGQARRHGLDHAELTSSNPALIYTSITAFGTTGPKAGYAASDLVLWAAGGPLEPHRDGDRPPLRISVPQAWLHAGADAAAGVLLALAARDRTGRGQLVDVSAQASLGVTTLSRVLAYAVGHPGASWGASGQLDKSGSGASTSTVLKKWSCKDGLVELHLAQGPAAGSFSNNLFRWMHDEGGCDDALTAIDWRTVPDRLRAGTLTEQDLKDARELIREFLAVRTQSEVLDATVTYRLLCVGICDVDDIARSTQLAARGFFTEVEGDVLPGRFALSSATGPRVRGRAPALGEHEIDWEPREAASASQPAGAPLDGLKVLDLSWVVAGPLIGRALSDFGATVVRVESSTRVETARLMPPFYAATPGPESSALYGNGNAGKLGVSLDLSTDEGRAVLHDLVAWADVVIESFSPGTMARWGLDYAALHERRPDQILLSTSLMGQTGPHSALAGFGNIGASLSGFQSLVGWPDRLPVGPFGPYTDYVGPRFALTALLAALRQRQETGEGCHLDVAQVEAGVFFLSAELAAWFGEGQVARRQGNADLQFAPHGVFACLPEEGRDRFVAIAVTDDDQWRSLVRVMRLEDDPVCRTAAGRREHSSRLEALLAAWTATRTAEDVERQLQAEGVPAHVAASSKDYARDVQLTHRGHLVRLPHRLYGEAVVEGPRYLLSETPGAVVRPAPMFGEHNVAVLGELLGYDGDRLERLAAAGALR
ncbi:MAG: CoA transferase [Mycobacteriales bacterium]